MIRCTIADGLGYTQVDDKTGTAVDPSAPRSDVEYVRFRGMMVGNVRYEWMKRRE